MYVNPVLVGVVGTLFAEAVILIACAVIQTKRDK